MSVSLVLPVHRTGDDLRQCLDAVAALDPPPHEVVVVVDGARPAVVDVVAPFASRLVPLARQGGPARARNAGARQATGDVLLFVDADVVVPTDTVARVQAHFRRHEQTDALIGSYDTSPAATNFLSQYKNLMNHHVHQRARTPGFTFWGACGAIRRPVFESLGGFDESYREPSIEDIELGYRLRAAGGRVDVVKDLQVTHLKRWDAVSLVRTDVLSRALPWSELILRSRGFEDDLNIDRVGRAKVGATGLLLLGIAAARLPLGRAVASGAAASLLLMDVPLLRFYARQRGPAFAAATVPWTWLSYAYSGGAFAVAAIRHVTRVGARSRADG